MSNQLQAIALLQNESLLSELNPELWISGEKDNLHGGVRFTLMGANGYGASIIKNPFSYGGSNGLYELAVLDKEGHLTYHTPITDDVIGHLSPSEVKEILIQIQNLPPCIL